MLVGNGDAVTVGAARGEAGGAAARVQVHCFYDTPATLAYGMLLQLRLHEVKQAAPDRDKRVACRRPSMICCSM